jgi:hypothetical protein
MYWPLPSVPPPPLPVTGAFGYSGAAIARELLVAGHQVRTLTGHPGRAPAGTPIDARPLNHLQQHLLKDIIPPTAKGNSLQSYVNSIAGEGQDLDTADELAAKDPPICILKGRDLAGGRRRTDQHVLSRRSWVRDRVAAYALTGGEDRHRRGSGSRSALHAHLPGSVAVPSRDRPEIDKRFAGPDTRRPRS